MVVGDREREEEREGFVLLKEMKNQDSFFTFSFVFGVGKGGVGQDNIVRLVAKFIYYFVENTNYIRKALTNLL